MPKPKTGAFALDKYLQKIQAGQTNPGIQYSIWGNDKIGYKAVAHGNCRDFDGKLLTIFLGYDREEVKRKIEQDFS